MQIAPIDAQESAGLRRLQPPSDDKALFESWAATSRVVEGKLAVVRQLASSGNQAAFDVALAEMSKAAEPIEAGMRAYGFKVCGVVEE